MLTSSGEKKNVKQTILTSFRKKSLKRLFDIISTRLWHAPLLTIWLSTSLDLLRNAEHIIWHLLKLLTQFDPRHHSDTRLTFRHTDHISNRPFQLNFYIFFLFKLLHSSSLDTTSQIDRFNIIFTFFIFKMLHSSVFSFILIIGKVKKIISTNISTQFFDIRKCCTVRPSASLR